MAVLTGTETLEDLQALADDACLYFGLGCRNVTQILVPEGYDFLPLLEVFRKYDHLAELAKYKNNYDYQLTLLILNQKYYMTNGSILLAENESPFSPISLLHYRYYRPGEASGILAGIKSGIQCIVGRDPNFIPNTIGQSNGTFPGSVPFGKAQQPGLADYADGIDTMAFLRGLQ